eukprot:6176752-Pleurochrysis_carterae.AAC.1
MGTHVAEAVAVASAPRTDALSANRKRLFFVEALMRGCECLAVLALDWSIFKCSGSQSGPLAFSYIACGLGAAHICSGLLSARSLDGYVSISLSCIVDCPCILSGHRG